MDNFEEEDRLQSDSFCKDNGRIKQATRSFVRNYGCNVKKNFYNSFQKRTRRVENIFERIADCPYEQTPAEAAEIKRITRESNDVLDEIEEKSLLNSDKKAKLRKKLTEEIHRAEMAR